VIDSTIRGQTGLNELHSAQNTFRAGKYTVAEQSSNGLFCLRDVEGHSVYFSMTPGKAANREQPHLKFVRDRAGEYVLAGVLMPGSTSGWQKSQSAIEKDFDSQARFCSSDFASTHVALVRQSICDGQKTSPATGLPICLFVRTPFE
jgi:hypothetical protein